MVLKRQQIRTPKHRVFNMFQKYIVENTRLGIPVLHEDEAPHGRQILDSVIYPVNFSSGCSFNTSLYRKQAEMISKEAKTGGVYVVYLSVLDVVRDPRWGRTEECFGEDPYLVSRFAENAVKGVRDGGASVQSGALVLVWVCVCGRDQPEAFGYGARYRGGIRRVRDGEGCLLRPPYRGSL